LAGEDFMVGLDRQRDDVAGQALSPVAGFSSTTAAGLARRFSDGQWHGVETGIGDVAAAALAALLPERAAALCEQVTIDLDTTDMEVYRSKKRGVACNYRTSPMWSSPSAPRSLSRSLCKTTLLG
jgi:hypothetical protein